MEGREGEGEEGRRRREGRSVEVWVAGGLGGREGGKQEGREGVLMCGLLMEGRKEGGREGIWVAGGLGGSEGGRRKEGRRKEGRECGCVGCWWLGRERERSPCCCDD